MGLSDNLMLIAPTENIIFDSFEDAVISLSKVMKKIYSIHGNII